MMEQNPRNVYKVCVRCSTYNHSEYIEDALDGFCMQNTKFPYICVIIDDASTDTEPEVLRNYLHNHFDMENNLVVRSEDYDNYHLTFAQHNTNKYCFFAVIYLKYNHYKKKSKEPYVAEWQNQSKYVAFCEGDDYWIDKYKLQRQVDFLDSHPDYLLHFHNALVRYQNHDYPDKMISNFTSGDFSTALLFEKWQLPLASVLMRRELYDSPVLYRIRKVSTGGITFFIAASLIGKTYGLSECLSVYRKNEGGVSNKMSPAYCMQLNYSFAKASGDTDAMKVMDGRALRDMRNRIIPLLRGDEEAKEMKRVVDSYNKTIFYRALWWKIIHLPLQMIKKVFNMLLSCLCLRR